jgi:hypothetical protein
MKSRTEVLDERIGFLGRVMGKGFAIAMKINAGILTIAEGVSELEGEAFALLAIWPEDSGASEPPLIDIAAELKSLMVAMNRSAAEQVNP